jgi:outer membrane protein OmpA-like peptidoglycan-associated protein
MIIRTKDKKIDRPEHGMTRRTLGGLLVTLPLVAATQSQAQTDHAATSILRSLAPHDRLQGGRRSVAITRRVRTRGREVEIDLSRRVEITVFFANDSTALRSGAQQALARLADALRDPILADQEFMIAGHTNSVGDYDYNVELSTARAEAVRNWLVSYGGIASSRLQAHGFGPDMLRNPRDPASPINRRVEVIAVTG